MCFSVLPKERQDVLLLLENAGFVAIKEGLEGGELLPATVKIERDGFKSLHQRWLGDERSARPTMSPPMDLCPMLRQGTVSVCKGSLSLF